LERALKEIREETGLDSAQIRLVRRGDPIQAQDPQNQIVWVVYPFLFESDTEHVRLDWEHDELRWIAPSEMDSFETVPHLKQAFRAVNPEGQA